MVARRRLEKKVHIMMERLLGGTRDVLASYRLDECISNGFYGNNIRSFWYPASNYQPILVSTGSEIKKKIRPRKPGRHLAGEFPPLR